MIIKKLSILKILKKNITQNWKKKKKKKKTKKKKKKK